MEHVGGKPDYEAENRFWTTATPIVRTFGHGGGSAEGNWIVNVFKVSQIYVGARRRQSEGLATECSSHYHLDEDGI